MTKRGLVGTIAGTVMLVPFLVGAALAQERPPGQTPMPGTPMPGGTPMSGGTPTSPGELPLGMVALEQRDGSGFYGTAVLIGSQQVQETLVITSLVNTGGGIFAPGANSVGHAVILSGTCEDPAYVVHDLGLMMPFVDGTLDEDAGDEALDETVFGGRETVQMGLDEVTHSGLLAIAVLDNSIDGSDLTENDFDPELQDRLSEHQLACADMAQEIILVPGVIVVPGQP